MMATNAPALLAGDPAVRSTVQVISLRRSHARRHAFRVNNPHLDFEFVDAIDGRALSDADRTLMWAAREQMSEVQSKEGASIKHDISVPIAAVPQLIGEGSAAVEKVVPGIRPCPFGHLGDGNIHFNFSQPLGADPKAFMAREPDVNAAVYEVVARLNGSVSAEHGIGQLKSGLLARVKDPVALQMMRAIKAALDPNGILNPGKVLG